MHILHSHNANSFARHASPVGSVASAPARAEPGDGRGAASANEQRSAHGHRRVHHPHQGHPAHRSRGPIHGSEDPTQASTAKVTLKHHQSSRAGLLIETQEGDVVRLRISSRDAFTLNASVNPSGEQFEFSHASKTRVKLTVDGDLNAEELAAIQGVVDQAGALAQQFFNGETSAAFETAAALNIDGQQLANVGLRLHHREQLTYSRHGTFASITLPVEPAPAMANLGSSSPAPTPSTDPHAEAQAQGQPPDPAPTNPIDGSDTESLNPNRGSATQATLDVIDQPNMPNVSHNALTIISDFIATLLDTFQSTQDTGDSATQPDAMSLSFGLKVRIFESIVLGASHTAPNEPSREEASPEPSNALMTDTLHALAATQEPNVELSI